MISDSSSEYNNQNFTTFHNMENDNNDNNVNDSEYEQNSEIIHHQCASFDKNYLFLSNESLFQKKNNISNKNYDIKNNKLDYDYKSSINYKNNHRLNISNIKIKNSHYINKSTDNIFLNVTYKQTNNSNIVYVKKK